MSEPQLPAVGSLGYAFCTVALNVAKITPWLSGQLLLGNRRETSHFKGGTFVPAHTPCNTINSAWPRSLFLGHRRGYRVVFILLDFLAMFS